MRNNTRSIHVRFNLDKPEQNKAWAYLMDFDRNQFGSYNQFMAKAIIDAVERNRASECPLDADACEMVNRCVRQVVSSVEDVLIRTLPSYVAGCFAASTGNIRIRPGDDDASDMPDDNPDDLEDADREDEIDWGVFGQMMEFVTKDTEFSPYLLLPRFLFRMGINETAILVYVLLLDRIRLSMGNEKWIDEAGRVFAIYPIHQLAVDARHGERIVKDALAVLEKADLIYRFHQGVGRPNLIYLKVPDISVECSIPPSECAENRPPEVQKIALLKGSFGTTNKNNRERTTEQKLKSKEALHRYGTYSNVFLTVAQHENLRLAYPGIDKLIDKMSCYLESSGKTYTNYEAALRSWAQREPETYLTMDYGYEEGESL